MLLHKVSIIFFWNENKIISTQYLILFQIYENLHNWWIIQNMLNQNNIILSFLVFLISILFFFFFFRLQGLLKKYFKKKRRESRGLFVRHTYTIDFTGLREKYMAKGVCGARWQRRVTREATSANWYTAPLMRQLPFSRVNRPFHV